MTVALWTSEETSRLSRACRSSPDLPIPNIRDYIEVIASSRWLLSCSPLPTFADQNRGSLNWKWFDRPEERLDNPSGLLGVLACYDLSVGWLPMKYLVRRYGIIPTKLVSGNSVRPENFRETMFVPKIREYNLQTISLVQTKPTSDEIYSYEMLLVNDMEVPMRCWKSGNFRDT